MSTKSSVDILLVDDRPQQLLALRALLEGPDIELFTADSGNAALRMLLRRDFAVILLDVNMPGMDGFELASLIRQRPRSAQTPIIFITANSETETHVSRGYSLGAVDYIHTPITPEILKTKVMVFVELHRKTQQARLDAEALRELQAREHERQLDDAMERLATEARQVEVLVEEQRRALQLQKLTPASLVIHSARKVDEVLRAAAAQARGVLEAQGARVWMSGEGAAKMSEATRTVADPPDDLAHPFDARLDEELCERIGALKQPLRLTDTQLESHELLGRWCSALPVEGRPRGWLSAPLVGRSGRGLGWIQVSDRLEGNFSPGDEALLVRFCEIVSVALENVMYQEAREANRLKDQFLATLSHELRTPLNAILGWTQLLRSGKLKPPDQERALEIVERNVKVQAQMIDDLLDMSRIVSGKLRLESKPFEIEPVIATAVESLRPTTTARQMRLELALDAGGAWVWGDPARLQQVVWNLVSNAIKFTPDRGSIQVSVRREAGEVVLEVQDDGEGISPELLSVIFERFAQETGGSSRFHGGLGLGLAIVRQLVEQHGGSIRAHSAGKGMGACFTVRLPMLEGYRANLAGASEAVDAERAPPLEGVHVLVVDDERDAAEMVATELRAQGAIVTCADSAAVAMHAFQEHAPDLLISDISMPQEDGHSLIRRIRALPSEQGGSVPAIALTALARNEDRVAALEAGFQIHFAKPVDLERLVLAATALVPVDHMPPPVTPAAGTGLREPRVAMSACDPRSPP